MTVLEVLFLERTTEGAEKAEDDSSDSGGGAKDQT